VTDTADDFESGKDPAGENVAKQGQGKDSPRQ
jgi:hypothetical protein